MYYFSNPNPAHPSASLPVSVRGIGLMGEIGGVVQEGFGECAGIFFLGAEGGNGGGE